MYIILGLGRTGIAVANYFLNCGIEFVCNEQKHAIIPANLINLCVSSLDDIKNVSVTAIVASPGISSNYGVSNAFIVHAKEKNIPIISDIHLFQTLFPNKKYIAVTGTNGKSTTATLIYEIFKAGKYNVALCGNIGVSPFANAINADICVVEISSFQLEITSNNFEISTIINLIPDHLDRYTTLENYAKEKLRITQISNICIVNENIKIDAQNIIKFSNVTPCSGYAVIEGSIYFEGNLMCAFPQTKLLGVHNCENIMAAFGVCHQFGVSMEIIIEAIKSFNAIEHRIEFICKINSTAFYNDSKATNVDATLNALRAIKSPTFLIAGGKLVESVTGIFEGLAFQNVKMIALVGSGAGVIAKELHNHNLQNPQMQIKYCLSGNIEKALQDVWYHAQKVENSVVLLSPFCKSFDQFKSFEERGELFKKYVKNLLLIK